MWLIYQCNFSCPCHNIFLTDVTNTPVWHVAHNIQYTTIRHQILICVNYQPQTTVWWVKVVDILYINIPIYTYIHIYFTVIKITIYIDKHCLCLFTAGQWTTTVTTSTVDLLFSCGCYFNFIDVHHNDLDV